MLENATRICGAGFGVLFRIENGWAEVGALHNVPEALERHLRDRGPIKPRPGSTMERGVRSRDVVHVADVRDDVDAKNNPAAKFAGARTLLTVPMVKENEVVGFFNIYRQEVKPFTDKQIELVKNFAAQAVIAIENTRLLNELRQRTDDLTESLEQQTATSEVLQVISSSAGELEPVFSAMLENATRLCEARFGTLGLREGDAFRVVALHNAPPKYMELRKREPLIRPTAGSGLGRIVATKQVVHIPDLRADQAYIDRVPSTTALVETADARSLLVAPMLKDDDLVGVIAIYKQEAGPFTDKQIELVKNFAAQAVIAIENTRLLNELRESLQRQTATSEVLKVISTSPGELKPVFDTILQNATRICDAKFGSMVLFEGDAHTGAPPSTMRP